MITLCTVPETWCAKDRRTDGQKKWHIEVGAPPKNAPGKKMQASPLLQLSLLPLI